MYVYQVFKVHSELGGLTTPYQVGYVAVKEQNDNLALALANKMFPCLTPTFKNVVTFIGIETDANAINHYLTQQRGYNNET